jgi:hypothetical protein
MDLSDKLKEMKVSWDRMTHFETKKTGIDDGATKQDIQSGRSKGLEW